VPFVSLGSDGAASPYRSVAVTTFRTLPRCTVTVTFPVGVARPDAVVTVTATLPVALVVGTVVTFAVTLDTVPRATVRRALALAPATFALPAYLAVRPYVATASVFGSATTAVPALASVAVTAAPAPPSVTLPAAGRPVASVTTTVTFAGFP